jgi:hypothetical protein
VHLVEHRPHDGKRVAAAAEKCDDVRLARLGLAKDAVTARGTFDRREDSEVNVVAHLLDRDAGPLREVDVRSVPPGRDLALGAKRKITARPILSRRRRAPAGPQA